MFGKDSFTYVPNKHCQAQAHMHTHTRAHAHTYTCRHTCAHIHTRTHVCTHMHTRTHTCTHTSACTQAHRRTHTCKHTYMHTHVCTRICTHIHMHKHTHTYTLTLAHTRACTHRPCIQHASLTPDLLSAGSDPDHPTGAHIRVQTLGTERSLGPAHGRRATDLGAGAADLADVAVVKLELPGPGLGSRQLAGKRWLRVGPGAAS